MSGLNETALSETNTLATYPKKSRIKGFERARSEHQTNDAKAGEADDAKTDEADYDDRRATGRFFHDGFLSVGC